MKEELWEKRMSVCRVCPLHTLKGGHEICNPKLYLNPITMDVSTRKKTGYKNGCGCVLETKVTGDNSECPVGQW